jgi:hypothetical protein
MDRIACPALGIVLAATASACTTRNRCVDETCLPVTGEYTFVFDPPMACSSWDSSKVSPAPLMVQAQADTLEIVLWPFGPNPHSFRGTLYENGTMSAHEVTNNVLIGLPYADLTGSFAGTDGTFPFTLRGTLTLIGATQGPDASTGGQSPECSTGYSLVAVERSAAPIDASPTANP